MEETTLVFPPWLDLPEPLAEFVLERLPLLDYIRFAAVCPKWRSIQIGHRLRHAPHPPPMANQLPWIAPLDLNPHGEFYSPSDRRTYRLPIPSSLHNCRCLASCRGWLLLLDDSFGPYKPTSEQPFLFNPITSAQIQLPMLSLIPEQCFSRAFGALSTPPTEPDCIILLVFDSCVFLYRPNDHCVDDWTIIRLPALQAVVFGRSATYCGGKFYYSCNCGYELYVFDPFLQEAAASLLVMRYPHVSSIDCKVSLQEICGELFSVWMWYTSNLIKQFRVFKADLSRQEWVSVETFGDHALFHDDDCSVFLLASDVGCKRNSIYDFKEVWRDVKKPGHDLFALESFDLGTGSWNEEDTLTTHGDFGSWFLPTLCPASPAKADD